MEINTCEQYVIDRLQTLEIENDKLKVELQTVMDKYGTVGQMYLDALKVFHTLVELKGEEGDRYISFDSVWEKYDAEKFDTVMNMLFADEWEKK